MEQKADHTLDFRGTLSTISLLKVTQVFHAMQPMQVMEILGCDDDTRADLFRVLPKASYELLPTDRRARCLRLRKRN